MMKCRTKKRLSGNKGVGKMGGCGHCMAQYKNTIHSGRWRVVSGIGLVVLVMLQFFIQVQGSHLPPSYLSLRRSQEVGGGEDVELVFESLVPAEGGDSQQEEEEVVETTTLIDEADDATGSSTTKLLSTSTSTSTSTSKPTTTSRASTTTSVSTTSIPTTAGQGRLGDVKEENSNAIVGSNGKRYLDVSATCDSNQMLIFGQFASTFKGRIYAVGYPDEGECGGSAFSNPGENVTFNLPLGQCGVQMMALDPEFDSPKRHEVTLYIQYSSFLQQVIDDKVSVSCVEVHRSPLEESMQILDFSAPNYNHVNPTSRQGRRMMGSVKDTKTGKPIQSPSSSTSPSPQTRISSKIGESWMEILHGKDPSPKSRKMLPVAVGQDVTLVISTKVMRGYDARIVNCSANDGSRQGSIDGFRSQQILDSAGCSVDTSLVPNFRRRRLPIESRNRMITLHFATFPAFKFPERGHLHVKCIVAYCQGPCPQEPCDSGINHFGTWRDKYGRIADALVDTSEIVNSVEVYAPELEDALGGGSNGGDHHFERQQSLVPLGGSITSTSPHGTHGQGRHLRFSDTKSAAHSSSSPSNNDDDGENSENENKPPNFLGGGSVCVSPGSIILGLVILGVVLVISATATLWFALKRSEARKYRQAVKHAPFTQQHTGVHQPYYRFSHW